MEQPEPASHGPEASDPLDVGHEHPDVTGGWLRPAVFGAMDGLVSNFALVMGVTGGSGSSSTVLLAGLAGLSAGAFSMAVGEYTSVASQSEFALAQVQVEREEIRGNADAEESELAAMFEAKGVDPETARQVAEQIHRDPETALRVHVREELGVDSDELASPMLAAVSSFVAFAVGALLPLLPLLLGVATPWAIVAVSLVALFGCGAIVTRVTARRWWFGGTRQLLLGGIAAALTFVVGGLVGAGLG